MKLREKQGDGRIKGEVRAVNDTYGSAMALVGHAELLSGRRIIVVQRSGVR